MKKLPVIALIQKIVSYNQAQFVLYSFNSQEEHERLKTFITANNISQSKKEIVFDSDRKENLKQELENNYRKLENNLINNLEKIHQQNFSYLLNYFSNRSNCLPRISLKVFVNDRMHTLFRDRYIYADRARNTTYTDGTNTAFIEIAKGFPFYLNNNIPESAKQGKYYNARLIAERVKNYKEPNFISKINSLFGKQIDYEWMNCWRDINLKEPEDREFKPNTIELCYKSTLIVPLALGMNNIKDNENFLNFFQIDPTKDRAIFGFLCLDNISKYFFKPADIRVVYIVSNLLSLYLIQYTKNTTGSETVKQVKDYLGNNK